MAKCRICGAPHKACGPSTLSTIVPSQLERRVPKMGAKRYNVNVRGTDTILLLSDDEAKAQGLTSKDRWKKPEPVDEVPEEVDVDALKAENDALRAEIERRDVEAKAAAEADADAAAKAKPAPANKAAAPAANK